MHKQTELPAPFRTIIAMVKFDDIPAFPAVGYMAYTSDTHEPYFAVFLPRTGYSWELVAKWDYLETVAKGYSIPIVEEKS